LPGRGPKPLECNICKQIFCDYCQKKWSKKNGDKCCVCKKGGTLGDISIDRAEQLEATTIKCIFSNATKPIPIENLSNTTIHADLGNVLSCATRNIIQMMGRNSTY
jgi:hypothetical protein